MTIDKARIEHLAKDAGERVAYAGETLRDLITTLASEGATDYNSEEHKIARKVFSETLAAKGRTKNSGLTQYAQAWDAVRIDKPDLGMQERSRKGASRHSVPSGDNSALESATPAATPTPQPTMTNAEAIAKAKPYIIAGALHEFLGKHGLTLDRLKELAADAKEVEKAAKAMKAPKGASQDVRDLIADAKKRLGESLFVIREFGKIVNAAINEADDLAIKHGFKTADVPATSPASASADASVTADEPATEQEVA